MDYQKYGIDKELVERVKRKMKNPVVKERIKTILHGVTKYDLQDPTKVKKLLHLTSKVLNEKLSLSQTNHLIHFIISQKIDPNNTFHLIKLWGMFR